MKRKICSLLALVLVFAVLASFSGCGKEVDPREELENGLKATIAAFGEVGKQFGYDEIAKMTVSAPVHQEMELYLTDAAIGMDLSPFYGSGFSMTGDSSIADRKLDIDMGLRIADYDAVSMGMTWLDDGIYFSCPEIFGDELLGFSMDDLAESYGQDVSMINPYELVDKYLDENGKFNFGGTLTGLNDVWTSMLDASTFENPESSATITAGADSGEADFYTMTVPADVFIRFVVDAVDTVCHNEYIMEVAAAAGETDYEEELAGMLANMEAGMTETITQPVVIEFAIMDKLLRHVETTLDIEGELFNFALTFGMGKNVADRIDLVAGNEEATIKLISEGSHVLAEGKFTDSTVFSVEEKANGSLFELNMDTAYDTKAGGYTWQMDANLDGDSISLESEGSLVIDGKTLDMVIDSLRANVSGMFVELSGAYRISESQNVLVDVSGAKMIPSLTDDELEQLEMQMNENTYVLLMNIGQNVPEIGRLIGF